MQCEWFAQYVQCSWSLCSLNDPGTHCRHLGCQCKAHLKFWICKRLCAATFLRSPLPLCRRNLYSGHGDSRDHRRQCGGQLGRVPPAGAPPQYTVHAQGGQNRADLTQRRKSTGSHRAPRRRGLRTRALLVCVARPRQPGLGQGRRRRPAVKDRQTLPQRRIVGWRHAPERADQDRNELDERRRSGRRSARGRQAQGQRHGALCRHGVDPAGGCLHPQHVPSLHPQHVPGAIQARASFAATP